MWIDFFYFEILCCADWIAEGALHEKYPTCKAFHERMTALEGFKEVWADEAKCMRFPFNNGHAHFGGRYK